MVVHDFYSRRAKLLQAPGVEHPVRDGVDTLTFYPLGITPLRELQEIVGPLIQSASQVFAKNQSDVKQDIEQIRNQDEGGSGSITRTAVDAISVELAKFRSGEKAKALEQLISACFQDENRLVLGRLLMLSLKDEFPELHRDNPNGAVPKQEVDRFLSHLDVGLFSDMVYGFLKAHKEAFGPLGRRLASMMKARFEAALKEVASQDEGSGDDEGSEREAPQPRPEPTLVTSQTPEPQPQKAEVAEPASD